jgi:hypothetical protein
VGSPAAPQLPPALMSHPVLSPKSMEASTHTTYSTTESLQPPSPPLLPQGQTIHLPPTLMAKQRLRQQKQAAARREQADARAREEAWQRKQL